MNSYFNTLSLILLLFCLLVSSCNLKDKTGLHAEEEVSGAYQSLNMMGMARAYPNADIPAKAHFDAWKIAEEKRVKNRNGDTPPWETMGPENQGGRTLDIAFNPQNPNTIYAGSASGGLWRSYSGGVGADAWEYVPTGFPVLGVSSITFAPGDSMVMYIGTGEVYNAEAAGTGAAYRATRGSYGIGILKSADGGLTWTKSLDWSYNQSRGIWDIKVSQQNPDIVYAATTDGVYKSSDAGEQWTQVQDVPMANSLIIHPGDDQMVLVGSGNFGSAGHGIYKTSDGGISWDKIENTLPTEFLGKIQLVYAPSQPDIVYASIGNGFGFDDGASWLCRSADFGSSFQIRNTTDYSQWQGWFAHDIAVSPDDPDKIIAIGIEVWRSTDGGLTLNNISSGGLGYASPPQEGPDGNSNYVHSDSHDVIYHPEDRDIFYVANDGGIHRSIDNGDNFHSCNGAYQTVQFYNGFSNSQQDSVFCMGGLQDNGTIFWEGGTFWTTISGGDGSWTAINPDNDNIIYTSYQGLSMSVSTNGGQNFNDIEPPSNNESTMFIAPYVIAQDNTDILYAGRSIVYKSLNGGFGWQATNQGNMLDGNPILSMAVAAENSNVLYAATGPTTIFGGTRGHVFVTTSGGINFNDITGELPDRFPSDMTVDPTDEAVAYICFSGFGTGHVFKTVDYGENWTDISIDLPDVPTNAVIVDPLFPDNIYIGNDIGVFVSPDGGLSWESYQDGLYDAVMVFDLSISPLNRKIRIASHGNGAFQRDLLEAENTTNTKSIAVGDFDVNIYPNPVVDKTTITYALPQADVVSIKLFDTSGKLMKQMVNQKQQSASQQLLLDASDFSVGTYYLQLKIGQKNIARKLIVIKQ